VNISDITSALEAAIRADTDFNGFAVESHELVNEDPDIAVPGWIGIYHRQADYNPLTLAAAYAGRYDVAPSLVIVLQRASYESGKTCHIALETDIKNLIDLLLANDSITSTVEHIKKLSIAYEYDPRSKKGGAPFFQKAFMALDLEVANG
jgi:hypothetical protein